MIRIIQNLYLWRHISSPYILFVSKHSPDVFERCGRSLQKYCRRNKLAHDAPTHPKTPDDHRENLTRDQVHSRIQTTAIERNVRKNKEDTKPQSNSII